MALVAYPIGSAYDGAVELHLDYDDQTLLIQDAVLTNNSPHIRITLSIINRNNGQVIRTFSRNANTGVFTFDVSNLNQFMVHLIGVSKYGPYDNIVPPFDMAFEVASH